VRAHDFVRVIGCHLEKEMQRAVEDFSSCEPVAGSSVSVAGRTIFDFQKTLEAFRKALYELLGRAVPHCADDPSGCGAPGTHQCGFAANVDEAHEGFLAYGGIMCADHAQRWAQIAPGRVVKRLDWQADAIAKAELVLREYVQLESKHGLPF
jgi:hypothetical protein